MWWAIRRQPAPGVRHDVDGLSLFLLGPFEARLAEAELTSFRTARVQALLIFVATESAFGRQAHRREALMELLWPGSSLKSARLNLRQSLYTLRQIIAEWSEGEKGGPLLLADQQWVRLNNHYPLRLDVATFIELLGDDEGHWPEAVELYRGDFLTDFYLTDSAPFEDWASARRAALQRQALRTMARLADLSNERGESEEAERLSRRQLEIDSLREGAYRQLMVALVRSGRRSEALQVYEDCSQVMDREFGAKPSAEMEHLRQMILREEPVDREAFALRASLPAVTPAHRVEARRLARHEDEATAPNSQEPPHNLPQPPTAFVGRERELSVLDGFIDDPGMRLVSIVGPGGMGKTRLAIEVARRRLKATGARQFPDGVYFVDLAPLGTVEQVAPTAATTIGLQLEAGDEEIRRPEQQLVEYLSQRRLLLVMDNFEHLLDGAALLIDILNGSTGTQLLVTSRSRLNVPHEQLLPLAGLGMPDAEDAAPDALANEESAYDAIGLFLQAARRIRPDYAVAPAEVGHLYELSRLVGGMPLALELAATWVDVLALSEIVAEVTESLNILASEQRQVERRHRSVRAAFDATWRRLSAAERSLFRSLSIFRGGFTGEAAHAITGVNHQQLARAAGKSLLHFDNERGRYLMHELLRQYGAEKLAEQPDEELALMQRFAAYFSAWLEQLAPDLKGPDARLALNQIRADSENATLAWEWSAEQRGAMQLGQALESLGLYYQRLGHFRQGVRLFDQALAALAQQTKPAVTAATGRPSQDLRWTMARLTAWRGVLSAALGESERGGDAGAEHRGVLFSRANERA